MAEVIESQQSPVNQTDNKTKGGMLNLLTLKNRPLWQRLVLWVVIVGVVFGLVALIYFVASDKNKSKSSDSAQYSYALLKEYKLPGTAPGKGLSFKKPPFLSTKQEDTPVKVGFSEYLKSGAKKQPTTLNSRLVANAQNFGISPSHLAEYQKIVADGFNKPTTDQKYQGAVKNVRDFVEASYFSSGVQVTLGRAAIFTNPTIKTSAWQFDVSVSDPKKRIPDETGRVVYIIGKNTKNYFLITSESGNWNTHKSYFEDVLKSIKINQ